MSKSYHSATHYSMVTQMYAFGTGWSSKARGVSNGHVHGPCLAYVGFRGLSLTPIQESPLLDSVLAEEMRLEQQRLHHAHTFGGSSELERWLPRHHHLHHHHDQEGDDEEDDEDEGEDWKWRRSGSLPPHWLTHMARPDVLALAKQDLDLEAGRLLRVAVSKGDLSKDASAQALKLPPPTSLPATCALASAVVKARETEVRVVRTATLFPKDEPMSPDQKRTYVCKLLLFAFVGFLVIAGIVLWIFSPAFT